MTTANNLGPMVAFTARAAAAVAAQQGTVPAVGGGNVPGADSGTSGVSVDQSAAGIAPISAPPINTGAGRSTPSRLRPHRLRRPSLHRRPPSPAASKVAAKAVALTTPRVDGGFAAALLPILLILAVIAAAVNVAIRLRPRR